MEVYINGVKVRETVRIPNGPKTFYVGYNLPVLAGADIKVSDIVIDGITK
jgi:hypothetical protein